MMELVEVFDIEEALYAFQNSEMYSASRGLLKAMGYPIRWNEDERNQTIEKFIYFTVQNKAHFNKQEMAYLSQIDSASFLFELRQRDIDSGNYEDEKIVFVSVDLNCLGKDRSENAYYITKILNKTYEGYVVIIFRCAEFIMLCTCVDDGDCVYMSEWFNYIEPDYEKIFSLLPACYSEANRGKIKDFYNNMSFGIARNYIQRPESYEYIAYQCIPKNEIQIEDFLITKQHIENFAEQSKNYYQDIYGDDYVIIDEKFAIMKEEDDEWTLLELDDFIPPDAEIESDEEETEEDVFKEQIDYSDIDKEILKDPIRLLNWIEDRAGDKGL